jgi:predicted 2-oxoglutarate/Fe(II)-dependent dioxygenase YbiX
MRDAGERAGRGWHACRDFPFGNSDFDGGDLSFPEYGPRKFKPPPGCAIIFPCSLLHAVSRVTLGSRYAFLPFLFDEEAAKLREFNNQFLGAGVASFRAN